MSFSALLKKFLPSYRAAAMLSEKIAKLERRLKDLDKKNEYLFWLSQQHDGEKMRDTQLRVFHSLSKAEGNLRTTQLMNASILERLKMRCDKKGIDFWLTAGTMLGAYRHGGFIPWDDDIDIAMFRADFEKLRQCLQQDEELVLINCFSPAFGWQFRKVCFRGCERFWVDIWICDAIVADNAEDAWRRSSELCTKYTSKLKREIRCYFSDFTVQQPLVCAPLENIMCQIEEEIYVNNPWLEEGTFVCKSIIYDNFYRDALKAVPISCYLPLRKNKMLFEGSYYSIHADPLQYLSRAYSDYLSFPASLAPDHSAWKRPFTPLEQNLIEKYIGSSKKI